jgi:hypothetical protein
LSFTYTANTIHISRAKRVRKENTQKVHTSHNVARFEVLRAVLQDVRFSEQHYWDSNLLGCYTVSRSPKNNIFSDWKISGAQIPGSKFCMVAPNVCRYSAASLLHVSLLVYKTVTSLLEFFETMWITGLIWRYSYDPSCVDTYHQTWHNITENMTFWYTAAGRTAVQKQAEYNRNVGMMPPRKRFRTNVWCIKYCLEFSYKQAKLWITKSLTCGYGCTYK